MKMRTLPNQMYHQGGYSDGVWKYVDISRKNHGRVDGAVFHRRRSDNSDKRLEGMLKELKLNDFEIAYFVISNHGKEYLTTVNSSASNGHNLKAAALLTKEEVKLGGGCSMYEELTMADVSKIVEKYHKSGYVCIDDNTVANFAFLYNRLSNSHRGMLDYRNDDDITMGALTELVNSEWDS